tara:strand:+ start:7701 stop:8576 length:876 start_codon:yes stop_codon:yes gene_type:complete
MNIFIASLARLFAWLIHIQPKFLKNLYGDLLGILWFDVLRIRRQLAINNTKIVFPDMELAARKKMLRWSLRYMGRSFFTYFSFPFINANNVNDFFQIRGRENLEQALARKQGVYLLSLHMGSYDFAAVALAQYFQPFYVISKTFKLNWLNDIWFGLREAKGIHFLSDRQSGFDILRALKKNGIVVFIIDQFMGPPIGIKSKFFGKETGSPMGLAVFCRKTRSPVVPVKTYVENGQNIIEFYESIEFEEQQDKEASILHMTNLYNSWVEKAILEHPEQWMWVHNRWKQHIER